MGGEGGGGDGGQWQPLIEGACADTQNPSRPRGGVGGRKTKRKGGGGLPSVHRTNLGLWALTEEWTGD